MRLTRLSNLLLFVLLIVFLSAFLLYPIWLTVQGGFKSISDDGAAFTLHHVTSVFTTPRLLEGLINSFLIAICTTAASIIIALPLAMCASRYKFPFKVLLGGLLLVPLILPPFVGAIGLHHLLGRSGALNTLLLDMNLIETGIDFLGKGGFWAVVLLESLHLYPIIYLNAVAALSSVDPTLEEAAENLGAGRFRRFRTIILPLIRPGLFAGATIVFIWSFTELGTPLMVEYHNVTAVQIFNGIREMNTKVEPYALTAVMLASTVVFYLLGKLVFGRGSYAASARTSARTTERKTGPLASIFLMLMFASVVAVAVLPHISVCLASIADVGSWYKTILPASITSEHFVNALGHELAADSIRNSLFYSLGAVAIDLVLGIAIAHLIVRSRILGRGLLDSLAMLPLAVPGLVIAFGYVAMTLKWPFGKGDPLEGAIEIIGANPNPIPLLIIAYAVRRLPYVVRSVVAGLEQTPIELEEASLNLGAGKLRTMLRITMPLMTAHLIAGGLLAFSFAMLEVSDSLILAQREEHFPITKAIYILFQRLGDGQSIASALGVWGMALLAVTLIGASMLMGKRIGTVFRV